MKQRKRNAYWGVNLHKDGISYACSVHQIVAAAFHGECPEGQQVRHRDGNKDDCTPGNLLYGTPAQNMQDAIRHGTIARGSRHGSVKLTAEIVRSIRKSYAAGGVYQRELAQRYGISVSSVSSIIRRETWPHVP
jgi:HNH endonuclease